MKHEIGDFISFRDKGVNLEGEVKGFEILENGEVNYTISSNGLLYHRRECLTKKWSRK